MSKQNRRRPRPTGPTAPPRPTDPPVLRARDPGDLLAVVPYQLGFHPADSLVVVAVGAPRRRLGFTLRVDLPLSEYVAVAEQQVVEALERNDVHTVVLVAYSAEPSAAQLLVDRVLGRLDAAGIEVLEALRADGSRWFSYRCQESCCPAEGTPYDNACHPLTATAVAEGAVALPDRATLERRVAPAGGAAAEAVRQSVTRVELDLADPLADPAGRAMLVRRLERRMREFVDAYVAEPRQLTDDDVANACVWAGLVTVRDAAWTAMSKDSAAVHGELWQQVLRLAVPRYVAPVASLTAFAAWLSGNGALAICAVERALAADPEYSMA
ncbi:MAG: DUF4192 family protein, partial [Propionibacteriales bacterium]|nr:DUF4192 family protein [Propionibacteriales bacterium]